MNAKYFALVAVLVTGCAGNYVATDPAHPSAASEYSDKRACGREADGGASGVAMASLAGALFPPLALFAASVDLPEWQDRVAACMRARGWSKV